MARQADLNALRNMIEQAYVNISSDPIPQGGLESARENLKAALALAMLPQQENKPSVS
jgi:hypothetical protein